MPKRSAVKLVADVTPVRHELVHRQGDEVGIVGRFEQVHQLMDDNVFKTLWRLLAKLGVQADGSPARRTTPPTRLHPSNNDLVDLDAKKWFPLGYEGHYSMIDLLTIPSRDNCLPFFHHGSRAFFVYRGILAFTRHSSNNLPALSRRGIAIVFTILAAAVFKMRGFIELTALHVFYVAGFGWIMPKFSTM